MQEETSIRTLGDVVDVVDLVHYLRWMHICVCLFALCTQVVFIAAF